MNLILYMILTAYPTYAQTVSTDVRLELRVPQATCTLSLQEGVDFGSVTGAEQVVRLSPNNSLKRGQSPGRFVLTGQHTSDYMISIDFPSQITGPGTPLAYEGHWEQAKTITEPFEAITGQTLHLSAKGAFERHFRVWGSVHGLSMNTKPGLYVGQISITITCN